MNHALMIMLLTGARTIGLLGCEQEGPAERAGAEIDESIEEAGDKLEAAAEDIEEKTDR